MADDTGAPHEIPFLEGGSPPSIHGITQAMAEQVAERLGFVGRSFVATEETRNVNTFATLTTPDRISSVVIPTNALIELYFEADIKESSSDKAKVGLFVGSTQAAQAADMFTNTTVSAGNYGGVRTTGITAGTGLGGLGFWVAPPSGEAVVPVNPQVCRVTAGTYDIEARYLCESAATVTVKNRTLWARVLPF